MNNTSRYQLTDDNIDTITVDLVEFLEENFLSYGFFEDDKHYQKLQEKVFELLEDYSNGYKNYN